jgi:hypothetical protein
MPEWERQAVKKDQLQAGVVDLRFAPAEALDGFSAVLQEILLRTPQVLPHTSQ